MRVPPSLLLLGVAALARPAAAEEAPEPEAPIVDLSVVEQGPEQPWHLHIANRGDEAVVLAIDPRLTWFEVKVPGRKSPVSCRVPDSLFPTFIDRDYRVELAPGKAYGLDFDPRLYCFAAGGQSALVPGALVTPHFGWPERVKKTWKQGRLVEEATDQLPPFVLEPSKDDSALGAVKQLDGESFALRSTYAEWSSSALPKDEGTAAHALPPLELTMALGSDAQAEFSATVSVKLANKGADTAHVYFRRELLTFEVLGPDGTVVCNPQPDSRVPDRQAFLALRRGGTMTFTNRLSELCPRDTFARPGLYLVNAWFDASDDGHRFGIDAFVGRTATRKPAPVRIHTGERPFLKKRGRDDRRKAPRVARRGGPGAPPNLINPAMIPTNPVAPQPFVPPPPVQPPPQPPPQHITE